ncbi:cellular communication network factor 6 [Protopterus annectens]|uniref:cellular communication network factor 6 n=1 Tax=Protopterus annectens TaxID=7888 RepID=UPI001CFBB269|nr:cellular communication network factor 6 [Protopterus annectens]
MHGLLFWAFFFCHAHQLFCSAPGYNQLQPKNGRKAAEFTEEEAQPKICHWPCKCQSRKPLCAPGVSSVKDGCGCCKMCAKQVGEICNEVDVCDPHKVLYCDYSADRPRFKVGVCAYMMGVGCEMNGVFYQNGQNFQPNSMYKCTCISGAIGCVPVFMPKAPAGLCSPLAKDGKKPSLNHCGQSMKNQQDTGYREMPAYRNPVIISKRNCLVQMTKWSPCSKTCGMGISIRITNDNSKCEMRKDRRLCFIRPCEKDIMKHIKFQKGRICQPTFRKPKNEQFTFSGCNSTRSYKPLYCGVCQDQRCCVPNKSEMTTIQFNCTDGGSFKWKMAWTKSCSCYKNCVNPEDLFSELRLLK